MTTAEKAREHRRRQYAAQVEASRYVRIPGLASAPLTPPMCAKLSGLGAGCVKPDGHSGPCHLVA